VVADISRGEKVASNLGKRELCRRHVGRYLDMAELIKDDVLAEACAVHDEVLAVRDEVADAIDELAADFTTAALTERRRFETSLCQQKGHIRA